MTDISKEAVAAEISKLRNYGCRVTADILAGVVAECDEYRKAAIVGELTARHVDILQGERDDLAAKLAEREAQVERLLAAQVDQEVALEAAEASAAESEGNLKHALHQLDAAEDRVAELKAKNKRLRDALKSVPCAVRATTLEDGPKHLSKDAIGAWVDGLTACEKVARRTVDAALEGDKP